MTPSESHHATDMRIDGAIAITENPARRNDGKYHRLHPFSLLFGVARLSKAFLLPAIVVLFFANKGSWEYWIAILFLPLTGWEFYRYFTTRYRLDSDSLYLVQGLVFRRERHVPLSRVQNIDLVQNPFHRWFKVAEVRIETASGSEPEASFRVVGLDVVDQFRHAIFAGRTPAAPPTPAPVQHDQPAAQGQSGESAVAPSSTTVRELHRIPVFELIMLGLISNRGLALVFIALGFAWELDLFDRINYRWLLRVAHDETVSLGWVNIIVLSIAVIVLLKLLSVIWVTLRFFDYRLARDGDDFRLSCGLLTRISATVPRRRIQFVSVHQTLLQRWLGRASIRIETAGGGGGGEDGNRDTHAATSRRWFVPTIAVNHIPALMREIREGLDAEVEGAAWQTLAPGAQRRMIGKSIRIALIATVIVAAIFRPWGFLIAFAFVPLAIWHAMRQSRFLSCARTARGFVFRSGAWTRRISATFFDKMQTISVLESPFDRRWRMATLQLDTAGAGPAEHVMRVPYLTHETANALAGELSTSAESAEFRW